MNVETLKSHGLRALASRRTWWMWMSIYVIMTLAILGPVLLASIVGDDTYWVTEMPSTINGYWQAFWQPLPHAFDFTGQTRTTALAFSERRVLALLTMDTATLFAVPPYLVWAALKTTLIGVSILSVAVFMRQIRFRDRTGEIRALNRSSVAFVTLAMPLTIALGAKSQNVGDLNGFNFYPSLTYGPFAGYLLFAALVLALSRRLEVGYRTWAIPVIALMMFMGLVVNLSYELLALTIPVAALVLAIQPLPDRPTLWLRWRARTTVLVPLAVTYSMIFVWVRWRIAGMPCHATDSCYPGTAIDAQPKTILMNFFGSFPGNNGELVGEQARAAGRDFPTASSFSVAVALVATFALLMLWASWTARARLSAEAATSDGSGPNPADDNDSRGLLVVLGVAVLIAVGSTAITGITETAARMVQSSVLPNRNGVITWSALALTGLVVARLLMVSRWRFVRPLGLVGLSAVLVVGVSLYFPRNILSAQENRAQSFAVLTDTIHREVALGDTSEAGDIRRCAAIADAFRGREIPSGVVTELNGVIRTLNGGYTAFELYHGTTFCSTDLGHTITPAP